MLGFRWIIENELAGAAQPGLYGDWDTDIQFLKNRGIDFIFSLTEKPLIEELAKKEGFGFAHLSIRDMYSPMPKIAHIAILEMQEHIKKGHKFLIHCKGGVGRTGMIGAAYLILNGMSAEDAIRRVRSVNPGYIQTRNQEQFLFHYEEYIKNYQPEIQE